MAKREIDWNKVFSCLDRITGLPLKYNSAKRRWYAPCHFDGSVSDRWDKLHARQAGDGAIQIYEQGNGGMSLWNWLKQYGDCQNDRSVADKLAEMTDGMLDVPPPPPPPPAKFVDRIYANPALFGTDNLFRFLLSHFEGKKVSQCYRSLNITANRTKDGKTTTTFWFVNRDKKICFDKKILYLPTGKRDKTYGGGRRFKVMDGYSHRCYFGEHLLASYDNRGRKILVVESEKTALLIMLYWGRLALATGGLNNIQGVDKDWILLPDRDASLWKSLYPEQVVEWWEMYPEYECGAKDDIGDYIIWKLKNKCK